MISPGHAVPALQRTIELPDMVAYAGATWDWYRLHYDAGHVAEAGLPGPLVDGQMLGALLAEQLLDWLGPQAFIRQMSFRFKAMVFAGETVRVTGEVTAVDEGRIEVRQRVLVGDRLAIEDATAVIEVRP